MKTTLTLVCALFVAIGLQAQDSTSTHLNYQGFSKLSGPRFGFTFLTTGSYAEYIHKRSKNSSGDYYDSQSPAFLTQYGYQCETRFADSDEGVAGLMEWVVLISDLEKGLFLPSASSLFGIRSSCGFEIAVGPNISFSRVGYVVALGKNFKKGNLNMPVNIVYVPAKNSS